MDDVQRGKRLLVPDESLPAMFARVAAARGSHPAFRARRGPDPGFQDTSYQEAASLVRATAHGLLSRGIAGGDRVAILADTSVEWALSDLAILSAGAVTTTIYPTVTADQLAFHLQDSGARILIVDTDEQLEKYAQIHEQCPGVEAVVPVSDSARIPEVISKVAIPWAALMLEGDAWARANTGELDARTAAIDPDAVASIVYTSGTTGNPKGAMLSHRNFMSAAEAALEHVNVREPIESLAFLPLAHCYQRTVFFATLYVGGTILVTTPTTLTRDLPLLQPEVMGGVPRLYERIHEGIFRAVDSGPAARRRAFHWAARIATAYGKATANGGVAPPLLVMRHRLADRLILSKLRAKLGATRLRFVITGSASIRPELLHFFRGIGFPIIEAYGLTETSAPSNANLPRLYKPGTVGPPIPGMEQKLAEDGEILMKGPNVFLGYFNREDETRAAFTEDGWFRSGDIGAFDEDGFLRIVDRKKEILVLSTGKNVAPVAVEECLKTSPFIADVLAVGTDRKYVAALVQPDYGGLIAWAEREGIPVDRSHVIEALDPTGQRVVHGAGPDLLAHPRIIELLDREVRAANGALARQEQVKAFRIVPHAFTATRDELTPTYKKKRRVIEERYADLVAELYGAGRSPPRE